MTILELMDAIWNNDDLEVEIYSIEIEDTVWTGTYDGFQPRDCIPKKYWNKLVDTFSFSENSICINY